MTNKTDPRRIELTWSIMHPVKPDLAYMREVIAAAADYDVDSIEICGVCHGPAGGLDGAILFKTYPQVMARRDRTAVTATAHTLREIIRLAHASNRPVLYWHREVIVPEGMIQALPGLLDENGEFDLLGKTYHGLLRSKIAEFFEAVPETDGLVLTLTEADYSVMHNSRPDRYPPAAVAERIVRTFATELNQRNKRFVLRSFGSIAQDYEDILAGARQAAKDLSFEIETKITPYDFSPFLSDNPYLLPVPGARISAEFESVGEFMGAGFLPAADPARIIRDVAYARARHVDRFAVRVDLVGRAAFKLAYGVNLLAFTRATRNPRITADEVWREWSAKHWPGIEQEMTDLMKQGIEVVKKTHFIDGHVIFHVNPPSPLMKWIKAGGIFSVFQPGVELANQQQNWGILYEKQSPAHGAILAEKDEAVRIAEAAWLKLQRLAPRLSGQERQRAEELWHNATVAARLVREFCRCIEAYFTDMKDLRPNCPRLRKAVESARGEFAAYLAKEFLADDAAPGKPTPWCDTIERDLFVSSSRVKDLYAKPLWLLIRSLLSEYQAELAARTEWASIPGSVDFVICGGITDEWRIAKIMHGCHSRIVDGRPTRTVGNPLFPNGYLECCLRAPGAAPARLIIRGDPRQSRGVTVSLNGAGKSFLQWNAEGQCELALSPGPGRPGSSDQITVRLEKAGSEYPVIFGLAVCRGP